eukprot:3781620-Prymnesium_polylepis.1
MLGTDGAWFCAFHALLYPPIPLSCVWREFLKNRPLGYRPLTAGSPELAPELPAGGPAVRSGQMAA